MSRGETTVGMVTDDILFQEQVSQQGSEIVIH